MTSALSITPDATASIPNANANYVGEKPIETAASGAMPLAPSLATAGASSEVEGGASPVDAIASAHADAAIGETIRPSVPATAIAALLARGDGYLQLGDVASARLFYECAADAGEANGALRVAETFDPIFLQRAHLDGFGNMQQALFWYRRARDLGSSEAGSVLGELEVN